MSDRRAGCGRSAFSRSLLAWVLRLIACALFALSGCIAESLEPDVGEVRAGLCKPEDSDPDRDVSFKQDLEPLLERPMGQGGCACHMPTGRKASGLELTGFRLGTYADLMRGGDKSHDTMVIAGDPCASLIVQKTSNAPPSGSRMPSDGPPYLSPSEHALLRDWILEGAHDN